MNVIAAFVLAQLLALLYTSLQALSKDLQLSESISVCEINLVLTAFIAIVSPLLPLAYKKSYKVEREQVLPLLFRCLAGSLSFILVTKAVSMIPLTIFIVIT